MSESDEQNYIYVVGLGVKHVKVGCTSQSPCNVINRLKKAYPKNSNIILVRNVTGLGGLFDIENRCKTQLRSHFPQHEYGHEHFVGDGMEIAPHVEAVLKEYTDLSFSVGKKTAIEKFAQTLIKECGTPDWNPQRKDTVRSLKDYLRVKSVPYTDSDDELATALETWLGKLNATRDWYCWNHETKETVKRVIQNISDEIQESSVRKSHKLLKELGGRGFVNKVLNHPSVRKDASESNVMAVVCDLLSYERLQDRINMYSEFINEYITNGPAEERLCMDEIWNRFKNQNYHVSGDKYELKQQINTKFNSLKGKCLVSDEV
jgi:hypothetical protein